MIFYAGLEKRISISQNRGQCHVFHQFTSIHITSAYMGYLNIQKKTLNIKIWNLTTYIEWLKYYWFRYLKSIKNILYHLYLDVQCSLSYFYWLTNWLTDLLTYLLHGADFFLRSYSQVVKKSLAFYGNREFITVFTRARHLSLSWARSIEFMPSHPTFWISILILSSHLRLGLPSGSHSV